MLFENLYEEADKAVRVRWRISLGAALFLVFCYAANAWITAAARGIYTPSEESRLEAQRSLKAAALCSELPKPEQFTRVNTRPPRNASSSAQVIHGFRSERDFDEAIPTFLVWFDANGWKRVSKSDSGSTVATSHPNRQLTFSKNNFVVHIVYYYPDSDGYLPPANYEVGCQYEDISFEIYD